MRVLLLVLAMGCSTSSSKANSQPAPEVPVIDDATVIARSHAFLASIDKRDIASFKNELGATFGLFEFGRTRTEEWMVTGMQALIDKQAPPNSRTCKKDKVRRANGVAIYTGL